MPLVIQTALGRGTMELGYVGNMHEWQGHPLYRAAVLSPSNFTPKLQNKAKEQKGKM